MFPNPSIFKAYDIRGIYPSEINEENFESIIRAIYSFFAVNLKNPHMSLVLGRDMRVSSPSLFEVAKSVLVKSGARVVDVGLVSTPTFYFACSNYGYDAGIQVTASHNPKEYAGAKFIKRSGSNIIKIGKNTGMEEVKKRAMDADFFSLLDGGSVTEKRDVLDDEVESALSLIDRSALLPFTIACDPANGMGALYVEKLFEKVPGRLIKMNFELDGTFPAHPADPLNFENLKPLVDKVREVHADLGIEPDGDGDRVFFIDNKGEVIPATLVSCLIAKTVLEEHPGQTIVVDIRYTRNVINIVKKYGGKSYISKVGHAFITDTVNKTGAYFAGESSGHFYFGRGGGAENSVRVILYILLAMSREKKPIAEILKSLQSSYESGEHNFILPEAGEADALLADVERSFPDAKISRLDGLSGEYKDWRFNIRTSNTEPLLRLNVEADDPQNLQKYLTNLLSLLEAKGAKPKPVSL